MNKNRYVSVVISPALILFLLMLSATNCFSQIHEAPRIEDYKVLQYDTLDVRTVKKLLFYGKTKEVKWVKRYDSDGYLIEHASYLKEEKDRPKLNILRTYSYNSDRTQCIEVWKEPLNMDEGTTFLNTQTYSIEGKILSKTELRTRTGELRTFEYSYDENGNCESISFSGDYRNYKEQFDNEYDREGRIVRQVHTHKMGTKYEYLRTYNRSGQVEKNSINNGQLIESFTYNRDGEIKRRNYKYDSTLINKEAIIVKTCVLGSDHYSYNKKRQLKSISNECDVFINNHFPYYMNIGKKFEYDDRGLLIRTFSILSLESPKSLEKNSTGFLYKYKIH